MSRHEDRRVTVLGSRPKEGNIGAAVAAQFISKGWRVDEDDCHRCPHPVFDPGGEYVVDDTDLSAADVVVCTLGTTSVGRFDEVDRGAHARVITACLTLPMLAAHHYLRERNGNGGRMVFVGSYAHDHVLSHSEAYCAAKAGLAHLVRCLAWDYTSENFEFAIVHPYHVPGTPMWRQVQEGVMEVNDWTRQEADRHARRDTQMGRLLTPREVAAAVYDVATADAWISGAGVNLYGGVR